MKMNAWVSALLVVGGSLVASCDSHDETPPTPRAAPAVREIIGGVPVDLADLARSSAPVTLRGHADASGHVRLRVSNAPGEGYTLEVGVHGQAFPRVIAVQRMHVDASPAGGTTSHTCLQNGCVSVQRLCPAADEPILDLSPDGAIDYELTLTRTPCTVAAPPSAAMPPSTTAH